MCPLRILLIFISATLAGFFLLRNIAVDNNLEEAEEKQEQKTTEDAGREEEGKPNSCSNAQFLESTSPHKKFLSFIILAFWTTVDMASGRYLWRNLVSSATKTVAVSAAASSPSKKLQ